MEKRNKLIYIIPIIIGLFLMLVVGTILGGVLYSPKGTSDSSLNYYDSYESAGVSAIAEESFVSNSKDYSVDEESFTQSDDTKLVYMGSVTIGIEDLEETDKQLQDKIKEYNGFIEGVSQSMYSKHITVRVPKDKFLTFYNSLSELSGTITDSDISVENYTKSYRDNERRIDILQTEYDELKELMKDAESVEDILAIKDRLSYITYDLESLTNQNNEIDYDVNYSTLHITLRKVGDNIIQDTPFSRQVKDAFKNSIEILKTLILGLISIWWVFIIPIVIFIIYKKRKKKIK